MFHNCTRIFRRISCNHPVVFLAFFWLSGFLSGMLYADGNNFIVVRILQSLPHFNTSFFQSLLVLLFPFIIFLVAFFIHSRVLCLLVLFFKGFAIGFCLYGFFLTYHSAAWLASSIFLFADYVMLLPFFRVCLDSLLRNRTDAKRTVSMYVVLAVICCIFNYLVVSPFAERIL